MSIIWSWHLGKSKSVRRQKKQCEKYRNVYSIDVNSAFDAAETTSRKCFAAFFFLFELIRSFCKLFNILHEKSHLLTLSNFVHFPSTSKLFSRPQLFCYFSGWLRFFPLVELAFFGPRPSLDLHRPFLTHIRPFDPFSDIVSPCHYTGSICVKFTRSGHVCPFSSKNPHFNLKLPKETEEEIRRKLHYLLWCCSFARHFFLDRVHKVR